MASKRESLLVDSLRLKDAYPHEVNSEIIFNETHISYVFLAGEYAYKIKKPIQNSFVDYSTLALRKHFCEEEMRLNKRFAKDIYLDVVAITSSNNEVRVGGSGDPIEFAVRMKRFAADALLSYRVSHNQVHINDVRSLAANIAEFHSQATVAEPASRFGTPNPIYSDAMANCQDIANGLSEKGSDPAQGQTPFRSGARSLSRTLETVELLKHWTLQNFPKHQAQFQLRKLNGHVRECHGDLHLGNVVFWNEKFLPFDGIEFCDDFRWIDTLSDAAFTAMDFAAHARMDFCHSFVNAYFESTGDYSALELLQWYLVYRAMVRAKVAALRLVQTSPTTQEHMTAERDLDAMLELAHRFTRWYSSKPQLWITYGLSGSGKTTGSEQVLQRHAAIRIRADVERKRLAGLRPLTRVDIGDKAASRLYSDEMTTATYHRLAELAEQLLRCNVNVIVDATCLLKWQREIFKDLAQRLQLPFRILAFHADPHELRNRILHRQSETRDASDAGLEVLDSQLEIQQHLDTDELQFVCTITE